MKNAGRTQGTWAQAPDPMAEYEPFPNEEGRNNRQSQAAANLREHGTEAELCAADVRRMPFDDGSFDVIVDFGTLFHIARPQAASAEIARVLAPGGMFVHETKASQLLSHPVRSRGRRLPRLEHDGLRPRRWAMLWASHAKGSRPATA